jgi:hypothetical protein
MKIGKLYQVKKYYWLLYPSKDIAALVGPSAAAEAASDAAYYSKRFNCNVSYIEPNSIFCLLEQNGKFCKILSTNGELGWIYLVDFYKDKDDIEEVNQ